MLTKPKATETGPDFQLLYDKYATRQQGLFTSQQAGAAGYSRQSQSYHVKTGDWERFGRGIFRLKHYPRPDDLQLIVAYLWATDKSGHPEAVISHDSALHHYGLATAWPEGVHLSVPKGFRREGSCPFPTRLHTNHLNHEDIKHVGFMRITSPFRTLIDLLATNKLESKHLREAISEGLRKGKITYWDMLEGNLNTQEEQLLYALLESVNYKELDELRESRRAKASSP